MIDTTQTIFDLAENKLKQRLISLLTELLFLVLDIFLRIFHADNLTEFQSHNVHVSSDLKPVWTSASYNVDEGKLEIYA